MTAAEASSDAAWESYRRSPHYIAPPRNPVHFECGGPACTGCAAEQEIAERNER